MTIYIDSEYRCYASPGEGLAAVETDVFNGKCRQFIEGHRFIPAGHSWTSDYGIIYHGEMMYPIRDIAILEELQALYEEMIAEQNDMETALNELGVTVDG